MLHLCANLFLRMLHVCVHVSSCGETDLAVQSTNGFIARSVHQHIPHALSHHWLCVDQDRRNVS
jgi:hypothetical protein